MLTREVLFHRLAAQGYRRVVRSYARHDPRLAKDFKEEVEQALQKIDDHPEAWPVYRDPYRWIKTYRFPYVLYYELLGTRIIKIVAVAHSRRRLGYWTRRASNP